MVTSVVVTRLDSSMSRMSVTSKSRPLPPNQRASAMKPASASSRVIVITSLRLRQPDPVEAVAAEGQQVGKLADLREADAADELDRHDTLPAAQVELDGLREPGQVV